MVDVIIIGAGPSGLACAIELQRAGLSYLIFDKGCVVNSLANYPTQMIYFTTPELMEIGDLPLVASREKPSRGEALKYYRRVVQTLGVPVKQYEKVLTVTGQDGNFTVATETRTGARNEYQARKVIVAIGYFDYPNFMGIPGEELPKVSHYYTEGHPFYDQDVAVIGAGNSAIEAALELFRSGARVTMIHRGASVDEGAKYWVKPDILNRIARGEITAYFNCAVKEITLETIVVQNLLTDERFTLKNDFVFAMTGYHPDYDFLQRLGIELRGASRLPAYDPATLETNVPGIYLAGVVIAGDENNKIFIENGRLHGKQLIGGLKQALAERAEVNG